MIDVLTVGQGHHSPSNFIAIWSCSMSCAEIGSNCPGNSTLPYGPEVPYLFTVVCPGNEKLYCNHHFYI